MKGGRIMRRTQRGSGVKSFYRGVKTTAKQVKRIMDLKKKAMDLGGVSEASL